MSEFDGIMKGPEALEQEAMRAARYSGEATAMIVNLMVSGGTPERAKIWEAEQNAWDERRDAALSAVPLNRAAVGRRVVEAERLSIKNNVIDDVPKQPPLGS